MSDLSLGFLLMGYGLVGVFGVLILFYVTIIGLNAAFPHKEASKKGNLNHRR